jgi:hypothetical protein
LGRERARPEQRRSTLNTAPAIPTREGVRGRSPCPRATQIQVPGTYRKAGAALERVPGAREGLLPL